MLVFFRKAPFFRFCTALCAGILIARAWPDFPISLLIAITAALLVWLYLLVYIFIPVYNNRFLYGMAVLSICVTFGALTFKIDQIDYDQKASLFPEGLNREAIVLSSGPINVERNTHRVTILTCDSIPSSIAGMVQFPDGIKIKTGEAYFVELNFQALQPPEFPWDFDYTDWLRSQDLHYSAYATTAVHAGGYTPGIFLKSQQLREYLLFMMNKYLQSDERALAKALILGEKGDLPDELRSAYATAGAMHVLAVSGLHVGIIYLILFFLLKPLREHARRKWIFIVICLFGIWMYAMVTGLSPSVSRAAVMFSLFSIGQAFSRSANSWNVVFTSAFLLLVLDSGWLFHLSFQLSYAAVFGILFCYKPICQIYMPERKIVAYFYGILVVSVAATLFTLPLGLYYFRQFPVYFLLTNVVVVPGAFVLLAAGLMFLLLAHLGLWATQAAWLFEILLKSFNNYVYLIYQLPMSAIIAGISSHEALFLYIVILSLIWILHKHSKLAWVGMTVVILLWLITDLFVYYKKREKPVIHAHSPFVATYGNASVISGNNNPTEATRISNWLMSEGYTEYYYPTDTLTFKLNWYRQDGRGGIQTGDTAWLKE